MNNWKQFKPENPDSDAIKFVMFKKIGIIPHLKFKLSIDYMNMFSDLKRR